MNIEEVKVERIDELWSQLILWIHKDSFWDKCEAFLQTFESNYTEWNTFNQLEIQSKYERISTILPEVQNAIASQLTNILKLEIDHVEQKKELGHRLIHVIYLFYILSFKSLNKETLIGINDLFTNLNRIALYILKELESNPTLDIHQLILYYIFSIFTNLVTSKCNDNTLINDNFTSSILIQYFNIFKSKKFSKVEYITFISLLNIIIKSLQKNTTSLRYKETKIIKHLLYFIGNPVNILKIYSLEDEMYIFKLQMKVLEVINILVTYPYHYNHFNEEDGFSKIIELILWVTITFPYQSARLDIILSLKNDLYLDPPTWSSFRAPGAWSICNHNLKHIFDLLSHMCICSLNKNNEGSKKYNSLIPAIIEMVLNLFDDKVRDTDFNRNVREFTLRIPELQLNVLSFLTNIIGYDMTNSYVYCDESMWKIITNNKYFLFNLNNSYCLNDQESSISTYLTSFLRGYIFQFIEYIGSSYDRSDYLEYTYKLMNVFMESDMLQHFVRSTGSILLFSKLKKDLAIDASIKYGFTSIMRIIVQLSERLQSGNLDETTRSYYLKARSNLINTFKTLETNTDAREALLRDYTIFEEIFALFTDYDMDIVSTFCIPFLIRQLSRNVTSEWYDTYTWIVLRYTDLMLKVVNVSTDRLQLLIEAIIEILRDDSNEHDSDEILKNIKERQNIFVKNGVFTKIIQILEQSHIDDIQFKRNLSVLVIRCLTYLMKNNLNNKEIFYSTVGLNKLKETLLKFHQNNLNNHKDLIIELIRMLFDGSRAIGLKSLQSGVWSFEIMNLSSELNAPTIPNISNPHIAGFILQLIPYFNREDQNIIFKAFNDIVKNSSVNATKICSIGSLEICIDILKSYKTVSEADSLFELITSLSSYNITARELKKLLNLFNPFEGDIRSQWTFNLLDILKKMIENDNGPTHYFDFDGIQSSLKLPSFSKWPSGEGFTLFACIRVESFLHHCTNDKYYPRIFSFISDEREGCELYFDSNFLNFRFFKGDDINEIYTFDFKFQEKEWYAISFSISSSNRIITKSTDLKLAVKRETVDGSFKYQKVTLNRSISLQNINNCYIGTSHDVFKTNTDRLYHLNTFYGQMSEIIIYEEEMSKEKMKSFLELNYNISLDSRQKIISSSPSMIYSPYAVNTYALIDSDIGNDSPICYDLSANLRDSRILGDLDAVHGMHARHVLSCISGGIFTLFPLLHLLDKHESSLHKSLLEKSISNNTIEKPIISDQKNQRSTWKMGIKQRIDLIELGSNDLLEQILKIICKLLSNSKELQYQIQETKGFSVLAYLLLKVSPLNLSANVLNIFISLLKDNSFSENLKEDIIRYIFLDFYIWVYSHFKVQKYLLSKVIPYALDVVKNAHKIVTVNSILENIRFYYWTVPSQNVLASDHIIHPVTKRVISQRPTLDELMLLRSDAYKIIRYLMKDTIRLEDTKEIIHFFVNCNDPILIDEIVDYIKELGKNRPEFIQHLNILNINTLSIPLKSKIHSIRANTISLMFHLHCNQKEYPLLYENLKIHGDDLRILQSLLQISLGYYYKKELSSHSFSIDSKMNIVHENLIPVLLKLTINNSNNDHKITILSSLKLLIQDNVFNRNIFTSIQHLDMYLFSFYMAAFKSIPSKESTKIKQLVIEIMTILTHHNIKYSKNSLSFLDNHISYCQAACIYNSVSCSEEYFIRFIKLVLDPIYYELKLLSMNELTELDILEQVHKKESYTIHNIIHLIAFVSDFISMFLSQNEDGYIIPSNFIDSGLLLIYMDLLHIIEELPYFNSLIINSTSFSEYYLKKGVIRYSNDISLLLKVCFIQIYNQRDSTLINRCIECIKSRLTKKYVKKDDIIYTVFHSFNAIVISFTCNNKKNSLEIENNKKWAIELTKLILPMFEELYPIFKKAINEAKMFNSEDMSLFKRICHSKKYDIILSEHKRVESILYLISLKIADIIKGDKQRNDYHQHIQKNGKLFFDKFIQHEIYENEKSRQAKESIEDSLDILFDSSIIKIRENYQRVDHRWRNIVRTLRGERGAWSYEKRETYYKLDKSENCQRMRLKFIKNHNFNDYRDALKKKESSSSPKNSLEMMNKINVSKDIFRDNGRPDLGIDNYDFENNVKLLEDNDQNVRVNENMIFTIDCEIIKPLNVISGVLEISNHALYFKEVKEDTEALKKEKIWSIDQIRMMFIRRYVLKYTALEIFLTNQTSYFLNFKSVDPRLVYLKIKRLNPPNLIKEYTKEECLQKWVQGQISNFEYLMCLNTLAGRTYNDLSQYPVFPWIIMDMDSQSINLNDPNIYRDLSKPVGALNDKRLARFTERYENLPESNRFFYGSHYSSAAIVLFYLMRVEPFTSLYVKLNDNSFDHPDRMFYSIKQTLKNCLSSSGDVKELIPEFFYLPEMFKNMNKFNFGCRQDGSVVDDVELPPWAKSPEDFVRINREALESEYVSKNLHNWIDLIFGYKQRGDAAIASFNLFHYMSYEGVVDVEQIEDKLQREAAISMIKEFGQTPIQLFTEPHPKREVFQINHDIIHPYQPKSIEVTTSRIIWIDINQKKEEILCIDRLGRQYALQKSSIMNEMNIKLKKDPIFQFEESRLILPHMNQQCKAFSLSSDKQIFIAPLLETPGLILINLESRKRQQSVAIHKDLVTAASLTEDGSILVTGSKDTTLQVWKIEVKNNLPYICEYPVSTLYGHVDTITHISLNKDLGLCLSLSQDNTLILHNLKDYSFIRDIHISNEIVKIGLLSSKGYIIVYTESNTLFLYSINGDYLTKVDSSENPTCMVLSLNGEFLITGGYDTINIRRVYDFKTIRRIYVDSIVRSINIDHHHIVAGLDDGRVLIVGLNFKI